MIGTTIAHYRIVDKLGQGGMGSVYKAEDTRLNRMVALKFLSTPPAESSNLESRFLHEARAAAALDHPNICGVYEINVFEKQLYIAMPLIDGDSLEKRIETGPRPLKEAITVAIQTAEALEEAHSKEIVHRDIKPANILVVDRERGRLQVKLLDFGLARLNQATKLTREGAQLGTAAYMSPEQAEGRAVDRRSDVWSLGVVLYEMVSGQLPFAAEYEQALFYGILNENPAPLTTVRSGVPMELERIVNKCLAKSADQRYQSMTDLLVDLNALLDSLGRSSAGSSPRPLSTVSAAPAPTPAPEQPGKLPAWAWLVAGIPLGALAMWALWTAGSAPATQRAEYSLDRVTWDGQLNGFPALSPDGTLLAFASDRAGRGDLDIWVKQVNGGSFVRITSDPEDDLQPSFSPDGSQLVYFRWGEGIYTVPTLGGDPYLVAAGASSPAFAPDGKRVAFLKDGSLYVSPVSMGEPKELLAGLGSASLPLWTRDGKHVLIAATIDGGAADWWAVPEDGSAPRSLGVRDIYNTASAPVPMPESWSWLGDALLFDDDAGEIVKLSFDAGALRVRGPESLLTFGAGIEGLPSASNDGAIALMNGWQRRDVWSLPLTGPGEPERLTAAESSDTAADISADGRRAVYISNRWGHRDIWTINLSTGQESNLTSDDAEQLNPILTRDGQQVAYLTVEDGKASIYVRPYAGGLGRRICEDCGIPTDWSPRGDKLLFSREAPPSVGVLDVGSGQAAPLLVAQGCRPQLARFSPDGAAVAFDLNCEDDTGGLYLAKLEGQEQPPRERWIELTADRNDSHPVWSPAGNAIYFISRHLGSSDIWSQGINKATLQPTQSLKVVRRFPHARYSMDLVQDQERRLSVGGGRLYFSLSEAGGSVWLMSPKKTAEPK